MEAAASPTTTNTPTTAPVFPKKLHMCSVIEIVADVISYDYPPALSLLGASVGLTTAWVTVVVTPPLPTVVNTSVTTKGVLVITCPSLFVVVMNIVVLANTVVLELMFSNHQTQKLES